MSNPIIFAFFLGLSIGIVGMIAVIATVSSIKYKKEHKDDERRKWTYVGGREEDSHRSGFRT